jgi:hypothetical protein
LAFHIDVYRSNLALDKAVVFCLFLSEIREIALKVGNSVVNNSSTSVDRRDSALSSETG